MEIADNSTAVNSEARELDEKALLNILRNRNQKTTADTGIFSGQHKES